MNDIVAGTAPAIYGALDRLLRNRLLDTFAQLRGGGLRVEDGLGVRTFGDGSAGRPVTVRVHAPAFYRMLAANGSVGAGEAYMDGHWQCDDLAAC